MTLRRILAAASVVAMFAAPLAAPSPVQAAQICTGSPAADFLGAVSDNLTVPANAVCDLSHLRIFGNVEVQDGGTLSGTDVEFDGNLVATNTAQITFDTSRLNGNMRTAGHVTVVITASEINGNLDLGGDAVTLTGNTVNGRVQLSPSAPACDGNAVNGSLTGCP